MHINKSYNSLILYLWISQWERIEKPSSKNYTWFAPRKNVFSLPLASGWGHWHGSACFPITLWNRAIYWWVKEQNWKMHCEQEPLYFIILYYPSLGNLFQVIHFSQQWGVKRVLPHTSMWLRKLPCLWIIRLLWNLSFRCITVYPLICVFKDRRMKMHFRYMHYNVSWISYNEWSTFVSAQ